MGCGGHHFALGIKSLHRPRVSGVGSTGESQMGIEKLAEEAAGAFAADKALDAVDPNAGILAKGAAIVAGFEGGGMLGDFVKDKMSGGETAQDQGDSSSSDQQSDAQADDQN